MIFFICTSHCCMATEHLLSCQVLMYLVLFYFYGTTNCPKNPLVFIYLCIFQQSLFFLIHPVFWMLLCAPHVFSVLVCSMTLTRFTLHRSRLDLPTQLWNHHHDVHPWKLWNHHHDMHPCKLCAVKCCSAAGFHLTCRL